MIFVRGGKPLAKPDPDLEKAIDNLFEQQRKEEELCPRCMNNTNTYNPVCARCDDFCNFKEKEKKEMGVRTDTKCNECIHKKVCAMLKRPMEAAGEITDNIRTDINGLDIVVSCINFERSIPKQRTVQEFSFNCE